MRTIGALTGLTILLTMGGEAGAQSAPPAQPAPVAQPAPPPQQQQQQAPQAQPAPQPQPSPQPQPYPYPPQAQPYPYPPQAQPYPYPPQAQPYPPQPYPPQPYPPQPYPPQGYGTYPAAPYYHMPQEGPRDLHRRGFVLGFSVGGGSLQYDGEGHGGFGFGFAIGGMLNSQVALLFDYSLLNHPLDDYADETHSVFGGSVQFFLARFLWLKGGVGLSRMTLTDDYDLTISRSEFALAGVAAVGVEVLQMTSGFAMDLQLRFAASRFREGGVLRNQKYTVSQTALLLGFNFY